MLTHKLTVCALGTQMGGSSVGLAVSAWLLGWSGFALDKFVPSPFAQPSRP